ncbi:MAG: zinc ABC transporter substrate-binding protein [candidate division NC10 bacterium]|nr:zinc ABC transporter substrate-binding protein [candidate division NC10 bacterium]
MLRALALVLLAAAPAWGGGPIAVVTTSTDLKALVEAVGGNRVEAQSLAPPLQDPHAIEVKPRHLARLKAADLLVTIGLDHEQWLARLLHSANDPRFVRGSPHYLDTSKGIQLLQSETPRVRGEQGVHVHGFGNPHYWLDPLNARPITQAILDALARLSPANRPYFEENRKRFIERLDTGLSRWSQAMAPHRGTRVVVVHDTWPYFAQRFGLSVLATVEPVPGEPPSPAYLATLTRRMREAGVKLLIGEPSSNSSVVSQVAARSGARVVTMIPSVGGVPEAPDYIGLFDVNIKRLTEALGATH